MPSPWLQRMVALFLANLLLVGCSGDRVTEIVVAISTDVPLQRMDRVHFEAFVRDETGEAFSSLDWDLAAGDVAGEVTAEGKIVLPATLGLVPGPTIDAQPLLLKVSGYKTDGQGGESFLLDRRARLAFVSDRRLLLRMALLGRCIGVSCGEDETCGDSGCEKIEKDPKELPDYTEGRARHNPEAGAGPQELGATDAGVDALPDLPKSWEEIPPGLDGGTDSTPADGGTDTLAPDGPTTPDIGQPDLWSPDGPTTPDMGQLDLSSPDGPTTPDIGSPDMMPHDLFDDFDDGSGDMMPHDLFDDFDEGGPTPPDGGPIPSDGKLPPPPDL